jgi:glycosyltransferase involved in cell wall biosynthesis
MTSNGHPRVLHIVPALFGAEGVLGGAERYALELARYMSEIVPTRLLTFGKESRTEQRGKLEIRVVGNPWYVRGEKFNPFSTAIFGEAAHANIIHCHQQHILTSSVTAAFANITGRKIFVTDLGGGGWDVSGYINTDRWYRGHLHISEYSRRVFCQGNQPWAHVILGGIDTEKFSPDPGVIRERSVLFVGRLLPHKGVDVLIDAMPADLPLRIIGQRMNDDYYQELQKRAVGKQITFHHDCSDADIVRAYRSAMCVVLPSVYKNIYGQDTQVPELLGQTLLEGMACGTPAICSDVASMPEIVVNGKTGFVVPPNDPAALEQKLSWFCKYPQEAAAMGHAARRRVLDHFTWPRVVERCLEIYQR